MTMKRTWWIAAGLVALSAVGLLGLGLVRRMGTSAVRIGVILPFSGPDAANGIGMRNAIRMAVNEANQRGGVQGRKVELVELDEGGDVEKATAAANKLIAD